MYFTVDFAEATRNNATDETANTTLADLVLSGAINSDLFLGADILFRKAGDP